MDAKIKLMNRKEVCSAFSTSSAGLHRGMSDGRFPRPYRTGPNSVRWKSDEVQDCIDNLKVAVPMPVAPGCTARGRRKQSETVDSKHG